MTLIWYHKATWSDSEAPSPKETLAMQGRPLLCWQSCFCFWPSKPTVEVPAEKRWEQSRLSPRAAIPGFCWMLEQLNEGLSVSRDTTNKFQENISGHQMLDKVDCVSVRCELRTTRSISVPMKVGTGSTVGVQRQTQRQVIVDTKHES